MNRLRRLLCRLNWHKFQPAGGDEFVIALECSRCQRRWLVER